MDYAALLSQLDTQGYALRSGLLDDDAVAAIIREVEEAPHPAPHQRESVYAIRNPLLSAPGLHAILAASPVAPLAQALFKSTPFIVRSLYFDKPVDSNWRVPWHQDRTVALRAHGEPKDFKAWTMKEGVPHALAPISLLKRMVTIRLHLDPCDYRNGALHVIPGSHKKGILDAKDMLTFRAKLGEVICPLERGGVMLMKPLLAHASQLSNPPRHRRVLHLEFADTPPSNTLEWHSQIPLS